MGFVQGEKILPIKRYRNGMITPADDYMALEEPLEIFIDGKPYYMTMRLPGDEIPLAMGYCFSEGLIDSRDDVLLTNYCEKETRNRIYVNLNHQRTERQYFQIKERRLPAYSGCGICGKELIEDICIRLHKREFSFNLPVSRIDDLICITRQQQQNFTKTGSTHAAAAFDHGLQLLAASEDIGRHNAIDKTIGKLLFTGKLGAVTVIVTTSRISYEVVQKAARTGAEILIGISSATVLAIELANDINLTLVGFARNQQGNIYSGTERICM